MMTTDDAERALTIHEIAEATALGMQVSTCRICGRPTLWKQGPRSAQPLTCGRRKCLEALK